MNDAVFLPAMTRGRDIHVVGQGALGSAIFQNLHRMHVQNLILWDDQAVEARNRFNQRVFEADIDHKKVRAQSRIADMIESESCARLELHDEQVTESTIFAQRCIVLSAVDSMTARRVIWGRVKRNPLVDFFGDGRLGMDGGKAYGLDPNNEEHIAEYEKNHHMHLDPEVAVPVCKTEFPMPATADIVAGHVLWRMIRWFHFEEGSEDPYDNFVGFYLIPRVFQVTEQWSHDDRRKIKKLEKMK